jgi:SAM-dependent methyltransferase
MHDYDASYFRHITAGSRRSAQIVVPIVKGLFDIKSVVDFGCGSGAWLEPWNRAGVDDVLGCDGSYVPSETLLIDADRFMPVDLAAPIRLGRSFDLVQSLEVAEHLPASAASIFIETLVRHAPLVLFSAALPGQGGEHHLNEQPYGFWRGLFRRHGFRPIDVLRPRLISHSAVAPWYRYNSFIYAEERLLPHLGSGIAAYLVPDSAPLREYRPLSVRLRHRLVRAVPESVITRVAIGARRLLPRSPR